MPAGLVVKRVQGEGRSESGHAQVGKVKSQWMEQTIMGGLGEM